MANELTMDKVFAIRALDESGWSARRIARELGIHRETVGRHLRLARAESAAAGALAGGPDDPSKPARNLPIGSGPSSRPATNLPLGSGTDPALGSRPTAAGERDGPEGIGGPADGEFSALGPPAWSRRSGPPSACEPLREAVLQGLEQGLSAQRIWQDLVAEHGFRGGYDSVKRFVRHQRTASPLPFRRMECEPGQEAQVDFGAGAPVFDADGRRRRTRVLRVVLSHSRKAYSEAAFREGTDEFLGCLEDAFWAFGGVPRTVVIDNPKTMVEHPDWYDPELNPKVQAFARHYGTTILPTRVRTPRHKGKVERGIGYVQDNALKGRSFASLAAENRYLAHWEATVADTRLHGTTRRQVGKVFQEVERPALLALPAGRFPRFQEARRTVHRDGHVEVARAYYSVPPEYLGRQVWVRWDGHLVRVFNHRFEPIAVHAQREAGRFSTQSEHLDSRKISSVERGTEWLLKKVARIGPQAERWAQAMLQERGIEGVRVLVGLKNLTGTHPAEAIEKACGVALTHRAFRLRTVRALLARGGGGEEQTALLETHPIIRDLAEYGTFVRAAIHREPAPAAQETTE